MTLTIENRCNQRKTRAFVAEDTVDPLATKLVGIIGERRLTMMERHLGDNAGTPSLLPGLRLWHGGLRDAVHRQEGRWVGIWLAGWGRHHSVGFGVNLQSDMEAEVRHHYENPQDHFLNRRENITLVELHGCPGEPTHDDRVRIEHWNNHGLGHETILAFDDFDPVQEVAWDVKGDLLRETQLWDAFCDEHGLHFEHPDHPSRSCKGRQSTYAENLAVLAHLAWLKEQS